MIQQNDNFKQGHILTGRFDHSDTLINFSYMNYTLFWIFLKLLFTDGENAKAVMGLKAIRVLSAIE